MSDRTAGFVGFLGFILTLGGVGGIEASMDNVGLVQGLFVSVVGLASMAVAVLALEVNNTTNFYN